MSLVRNQINSIFNESSFVDGTLRDSLGNWNVWPSLSKEKVPWSLKEEATTKQQVIEQAEIIRKLQLQLRN